MSGPISKHFGAGKNSGDVNGGKRKAKRRQNVNVLF